MSVLTLRPYQRDAVDAVEAALERGMRRPAVVMATGLGKTPTLADLGTRWLSRNPGRRVLVIAHTTELLDQAMAKWRSVAPGLRIGRVQANLNETLAPVVVASVQTLRNVNRRRMLRDVGMIIVDECHHSVSSSYLSILTHFGALDGGDMDGAAVAVGFTATMMRGDDLALGDVWQDVVYERGIADGIADGFLVRPRGLHIQVDDLDLTRVRSSGKDYREADLGEAIEQSLAPEAIAKAVAEHADQRKILLFAPTVHSAEVIGDALRDSGRSVGLIHGGLAAGPRKAVLDDFRGGATQVLAGCMVLCLDAQTEILTDGGWVGMDDMTARHRVANWDQGDVFFAEPRQVVRRWLGEQESMYRLLTRGRDVRVTGGHRMLYRTTDAGRWLKAPVEDLVGRDVQIPTVGTAAPALLRAPQPSRRKASRAVAISSMAHLLRKREGYDLDSSRLEAARRVDHRDSLRHVDPADLTLAQCRFIGFWIGDGSKNQLRRGGVEYTASQALVYPRIIDWFDRVIADCGIDSVRRVRSGDGEVDHVRWSFPRGTGGGAQERVGVFGIEPYLAKDGTQLLWGMSVAQLDALLEGLWHADGNHGKAESGYPDGWTISAKRKCLLDLLQSVGTVRGMNLTVRVGNAPASHRHEQMWILTRSKSGHHSTAVHRFESDPSPWMPERVWCVQTQTRNIITRRGGTVTVMGNTEGFDEPAADCVVIARPTRSPVLYRQMAGRVLRPYPGKVDALLLDVVGATRQHGLMSGITLFGEKPGVTENDQGRGDLDEFDLANEDEAELAPGQQDARQALGWVDGPLVATEVDLFAGSGMAWLRTRAGVFFLAAGERYIAIVPGEGVGYDVTAMHKDRQHTGRWIQRGVEDLSYAMAWAENEVTPAEKTTASRERSWRARPPSEKLRAFAERLGITVPAGARMGEVSNMVTLVLASRRIDPHLPQWAIRK